MNTKLIKKLNVFLLLILSMICTDAFSANDTYYDLYSTQTTPHVYEGNYLTGLDFPIGAIGGGTIRMNGKAERAWWQIFNNFEEKVGSGIVPNSFFAIRTNTNGTTVVKALQTSSLGQFSAMNSLKFTGEFPFGWFNFNDNALPVEVKMEAFNPLIPMDLKNSAIPCAIFKITVKNTSANTSSVSILGTQQNVVGFDGYGTIYSSRKFSGYGSNVNNIVSDASSTSLKMTGTKGSLQLSAYETGMSSTASWDNLGTLYDDFSADGVLTGATTASSPSTGTTVDGALAKDFTLAPGEEKTITFVLSWYMPDGFHGHASFPVWSFRGQQYENWWTDANDVDAYVKTNFNMLDEKTRLYHQTLYSSNIPRYVIDRINSNLCVLKSPTAFWAKNGYFGVWESTSNDQGWWGNCKHVYQYAQGIAWIFPELSRKMMVQNLNSQAASGLLLSRDGDVLSAIDGHLGTILGIYRDYLLTDDNTWLTSVWAKTKKAMDAAISTYDSDKNGMLTGELHNTLDCSTSGTNPVTGSMYVAALKASARMAEKMNDLVSRDLYNSISELAKTNQTAQLWDDNLKYFIEKSQNTPGNYEYGNGCNISMFDGQWWSNMLDLGQIYPLDKTIISLSQIYNRNKVTDVDGSYVSVFRDFLGTGDNGWIMNKFPGATPTKPVLYYSEVMSGFEYAYAATMLQYGMINEGLDVVNNIAKRYDGRLRGSDETTTVNYGTVYGAGSPFGEDECGDFYGRALSSWSVLTALQGFIYDGPNKTLKFIPKWKSDNHVSFFSSSNGYGVLSQTQSATNQLTKIEVKSGVTKIRTLVLAVPNTKVAQNIVVKLDGTILPISSIGQSGNTLTVSLTNTSDVNANSNITVSFDLVTSTQTTFTSDFNDGTLTGWTQVGGLWSNVNNSIQGTSPGNGLLTKNDYVGTDFSYEADIKLTTKGAAGVLTFRGNADGSNSYLVALDDASGVIKLYKFPYQSLATAPQTYTPDTWYHLKVVVAGQNIKVYFENQNTPAIDFNDATYASGKFGLNVWASTVLFDNVKITMGAGTTLNNDATLTDLKVDGVSISGFSPEKIAYTVLVPSTSTTVPVVSAVLSDIGKATLSISQAVSITGTANITVTAQDGITFKNYIVSFKYDKEPIIQFQPFLDTFDNGGIAGWTVLSGTWTNPATAIQGISPENGQVIKNTIIGNNFTYEADVKMLTANAAGVLTFRSSADGTGTYLVALDAGSAYIKFYKFPYQSFITVPYMFNTNVVYHLKIVAEYKNIKVYINNNATAVIDFNDTSYTSGQFGLNVWAGTAVFDNVKASPLAESPNGIEEKKTVINEWSLTNNTLKFNTLPTSNIEIYSMTGIKLQDYNPNYQININLQKGIYIVKVENKSAKIILF
jgi:non-lysosomal glucosylceramidase